MMAAHIQDISITRLVFQGTVCCSLGLDEHLLFLRMSHKHQRDYMTPYPLLWAPKHDLQREAAGSRFLTGLTLSSKRMQTITHSFSKYL
jgi:hypothetical protein